MSFDFPGKAQVNRIVNFLMWLVFCLMAATGCLLAYRLPPGSRGGGGLTAWGWSRHEWGALHLWTAYALIVLVVIHLVLHWRWYWSMTGVRLKTLLLAGLIAGILAVAAIWLIPVERGADGGHGRGQGEGWRGGRFGPSE